MGDYLSDVPPVRVSFRGRVDGLRKYGERAMASIRVPHDGSGIPLRSWSVGGALELMTSAHDGSVCEVVVIDGASSEPMLDIGAIDSVEVEQVEVAVSLVDATVAVCAAIGDTCHQHEVVLGGRSPVRWVRLGGDELLIGIDSDGYLAAIVFRTIVPVPEERRITIRLDRGGSSTAYGTRSVMVSTDARFDPGSMSSEELEEMFSGAEDGAACERLEHLEGFEEQGDVYLNAAGSLRSMDVPATAGLVVVPSVDAKADEVEVRLTWPARIHAIAEILAPDRARFRIVFDEELAERWVALDGLLVGLVGDRLAELVVADAAHVPQDDWTLGGEMDPESMDEEAMMAMHQAEMARHFASEIELAEAFADAPPWPVYVVATAPDLPVLMEPQESSWGGGRIAAVTMKWDDHLAMYDAERAAHFSRERHLLPRLEVETSTEPRFDPPGHEHPQEGWWLAEAARRYDDDNANSTPRQREDEHALFEERARELERSGEPTTMVVDGVDVAGSVIRTDAAYVASCEVDGRRITVRAANLGNELPELVSAVDLGPAVSAFRASRMGMQSMMSAGQSNAAAIPAEIAEAKARTRDLLRRLDGSDEPCGAASRSWADAFTADVVAGHGGPDVFDARFRIISQAVQSIRGTVFAMDRDGTVAHAQVDVSLPRPDGSGRSSCYGVPDLWNHTAEEVREASSRQLERGEMADYELVINVLLARQGNGDFAIETDLLGRIEDLTGGIDGLLGSTAPQSR